MCFWVDMFRWNLQLHLVLCDNVGWSDSFTGWSSASRWALEPPTWRIIPVSKWLATPIYMPFRPFGRGITPVRGLTNHGYQLLTNWDDPPSRNDRRFPSTNQPTFGGTGEMSRFRWFSQLPVWWLPWFFSFPEKRVKVWWEFSTCLLNVSERRLESWVFSSHMMFDEDLIWIDWFHIFIYTHYYVFPFYFDIIVRCGVLFSSCVMLSLGSLSSLLSFRTDVLPCSSIETTVLMIGCDWVLLLLWWWWWWWWWWWSFVFETFRWLTLISCIWLFFSSSTTSTYAWTTYVWYTVFGYIHVDESYKTIRSQQNKTQIISLV